VVGLSHKIRQLNKKNIDNYVEIYIKSELKKIKKKRLKKLYSKNLKNIWGIDIKPELPKNPTITINNNFKKKTKQMADLLIKKIKKV
jgi:adenylylsulfate kinase-like enzyme